MPIEVIRPQLRTLRADQLSDLKREWACPWQPSWSAPGTRV
jgi:hypothetical protein